MRACWRCHGDGVVAIPGYSINPYTGTSVQDPQCETDERCDICHGTGEIEDGVTAEELRNMIPGFIYDIRLIDENHELASRCRNPGAVMRMRFEEVRIELSLRDPRSADNSMRHPVVYMIWGEAIYGGDTPAHVHMPAAEVFEHVHPGHELRYGMHSWLVKEIDSVNG